eukprot:TRINITY_DN22020_c0_g1_i1.p1 TRINITY_DN22020_c0_g1~~TRINITY_DN22020_c0_g1_i1.p1  ORF type:complete len:462 (-),score=67.41 TRINITY_DN22020_c0_g1_i1:94-1278(-)
MVTTPVSYASSVLTNEAGQASNAMLNGATLVCSLFFASLIFGELGAKRGLSLALGLQSIYVILFATSAGMCTEMDEAHADCIRSTAQQLPTALIGSLIGGIGAGVMWTSQGAFFSLTCAHVAKAEQKELRTITSELSGYFAVVFLAAEALARASATLMCQYLRWSYPAVFYLMAGVAAAAMVAFMALASGAHQETPPGSVCDKTLDAVRLWKHPNIWLLQFTNLTFGFAAAWLNGYVNRNVLSTALSSGFIGIAGALQSGLSSLLAGCFGMLSTRFGKMAILALGSVSSLSLAVLSKFGHPQQWGWGVLIFYLFQGIARAVYESTNKSIFADFFPGEKRVGAFANVFVFSTGASTVAFFFGATGHNNLELYSLMLCAVLTVPAFSLASASTSQD